MAVMIKLLAAGFLVLGQTVKSEVKSVQGSVWTELLTVVDCPEMHILVHVSKERENAQKVQFLELELGKVLTRYTSLSFAIQ